MRGEQAFSCGFIDYLRRNRSAFENLGWNFDDLNAPPPSDFQNILAYAIPGGWFEHNKISICQIRTGYFAQFVNLQTRTYSASNVAKANEIYGKHLTNLNPYNWFSRFLSSGLQNAAKKFVQAQSSTDLARIAIALERHHLAHASYPESLDALVPQWIAKLPHDVINGQPLKYRRTETNSFILYSVGWNEKDDGGTVVMGSGKTPSVDQSQGDWVWASEAK
jgi:hypothetical protein